MKNHHNMTTRRTVATWGVSQQQTTHHQNGRIANKLASQHRARMFPPGHQHRANRTERPPRGTVGLGATY